MAIRSHFDPATLMAFNGFAGNNTIKNSGALGIDNTDQYADMKLSAAKLAGNMGVQYAKNKSVPTFSHIDPVLNKLVMNKPEGLLSLIAGQAPLMENQIYKSDVPMQTELFNHNENVKEMQAAKVAAAEAQKVLDDQIALENDSAFQR